MDSLSGSDLAAEISRITEGDWNPGPGSIYLILSELLRKGYLTELPKREGNVRRYIISGKGKAELAKMSGETEGDVARQIKLLAIYSRLAGNRGLESKLTGLGKSIKGNTDS